MNEDVRLRDGLRTCLLVFLTVRLGLFALSAVGVGIVPLPPGQPTGVPRWPAPELGTGLDALFTATERQDALWFLRIATDGYRADDPSAAFLPLYPLAVRILAAVPGLGTLAAALIVSNGAFLGSLLVLHGLVRLDADDRAADRAVRYTAVFPTAFFLMAPYSESLFLLLALVCFWFARRDRWALVGAAGLGVGLTRWVGVVLPLALAFEAIRTPDARRLAGRLAAAATPLLGAAGIFGAWWALTGQALRPLEVQSIWRPEASRPWTAVARGVEYAVRFDGWWLVDAIFLVGAVAVLVAGARLLRPSLLVYGLASLALPLFAMFPDRPFLSIPRFCAVLFPVPLVLARQRLIPEAAVTITFTVGWAILAVLFMNWQYIF